jgi:hypothetical protein
MATGRTANMAQMTANTSNFNPRPVSGGIIKMKPPNGKPLMTSAEKRKRVHVTYITFNKGVN